MVLYKSHIKDYYWRIYSYARSLKGCDFDVFQLHQAWDNTVGVKAELSFEYVKKKSEIRVIGALASPHPQSDQVSYWLTDSTVIHMDHGKHSFLGTMPQKTLFHVFFMCWRQTGGAFKNKRRAYHDWIFNAQVSFGLNTARVLHE